MRIQNARKVSPEEIPFTNEEIRNIVGNRDAQSLRQPKNLTEHEVDLSQKEPEVKNIDSPEAAKNIVILPMLRSQIADAHARLLGEAFRKETPRLTADQLRLVQADSELKKLKEISWKTADDPVFINYAQEQLQKYIPKLAERVRGLAHQSSRTPDQETAFLNSRNRLRELNEAARYLGVKIDLGVDLNAREVESPLQPAKRIDAANIQKIIDENFGRVNLPGVWDKILERLGISERQAKDNAETQAVILTGRPFIFNGQELIWAERMGNAQKLRFLEGFKKVPQGQIGLSLSNILNEASGK